MASMPSQPSGGPRELGRGLSHPSVGPQSRDASGPIRSLCESEEVLKWKRRSKADKKRYRRLLSRYRTLKEEADMLSRVVVQKVDGVYESGMPEGWEYLVHASDELDRKFKLSVKNFEALLNQVSLARAINVTTSMTSHLIKKARVVLNPRLGKEERIRDYLSQVARDKEKEFMAPRPRPRDSEIMREIEKVEEAIEDINGFQRIVSKVTDFIARIETGDVDKDQIRTFKHWMEDCDPEMTQQWMVKPYEALKEEFKEVVKKWRQGGTLDREKELRLMGAEELALRKRAEDTMNRGTFFRFLERQVRMEAEMVPEREEVPVILGPAEEGLERSEVEERLDRISNMFSRGKK